MGISMVFEQDTNITLTHYTDSRYELKSVVPVGWKDMGQGLYMRGKTPTDSTLLGQQSSPLAANKLLLALLPQLNLSGTPANVGTYQSSALTWTLYKIESKTAKDTLVVDLGLADGEAKSCVVLLQATADEYDTLHKMVFQPILDALTPYVEPTVKVPYQHEEGTFKSGDVTLAGTLTMPLGKGPFVAVILITGSGPQDRDETIGAMKPFGMIADELTRAGMAVLRYDDRGVGGSGGDIFTTIEETTSDASAAITYLIGRVEINHNQIGVLGHSEGGIVAAALGASVPQVDFVIVMAGPAVSGKAILLEQGKRILKAEGGTDAMAAVQASFQPAIWDAVERNDATKYKKLEVESMLAVWKLLPKDQQKALGNQEAYAQKMADQLA